MAHLTVAIDDGQGYANYGEVLNYLVTITNAGPTDANDIGITETLSQDFDATYTRWTCINGGNGTSCTASGTGPLIDSNVVIPASRSLTWLISAPVLVSAPDPTADNSINVTTQADPNAPYNVTDSDILVIFRNGFENPFGYGTQSIAQPTVSASTSPVPLSALVQPMTVGQSLTLVVPDKVGAAPVDILLRAHANDGSGFRIERMNLGVAPSVRLIAIDSNGAERPSDWAPTSPAGTLVLALDENQGNATVLLETEKAELTMTLPSKAQSYHIDVMASP